MNFMNDWGHHYMQAELILSGEWSDPEERLNDLMAGLIHAVLASVKHEEKYPPSGTITATWKDS